MFGRKGSQYKTRVLLQETSTVGKPWTVDLRDGHHELLPAEADPGLDWEALVGLAAGLL